jgi:hypothetical protein
MYRQAPLWFKLPCSVSLGPAASVKNGFVSPLIRKATPLDSYLRPGTVRLIENGSTDRVVMSLPCEDAVLLALWQRCVNKVQGAFFLYHVPCWSTHHRQLNKLGGLT